ncbi:MAG: GDSL-type esterase/lipase family protein [Hyphomicrobiaceae bacterium]
MMQIAVPGPTKGPEQRWSPFVTRAVLFWVVGYSALCIPFLGAQAQEASQAPCGLFAGDFAATPSIPDTSIAFERHEMQMRMLPGEADVIIIGDSLVQAWPAELLREAFGDQRILNLGVGRDRLPNVLFRLRDKRLASARLQPDLVALMAGTNSITIPDAECVLPIGASAIVDQLRSLWPLSTIIVIGVLPRGAMLRYYQRQRLALNGAFLHLAQTKQSVKYIDLEKVVDCDLVFPCANYQPDMLHLTRAGYERISAALKASLARP